MLLGLYRNRYENAPGTPDKVRLAHYAMNKSASSLTRASLRHMSRMCW